MMWFLFMVMGTVLAQEAALTPARQFEDERLRQLLNVRRIYIEKLTGENAEQIRDMLMTSLQHAKLFIVTENAERADAMLKGSAEDLIYTDTFQASDGVNARGAFSVNNPASSRNSSRRGVYAGASVGDNESTRTAERKHEAMASLRLVNRDGDLIWSATQESQGAKFRGAAADVADKITRKLQEDYELARKRPAVKSPVMAAQPK
ncbi:MAG: hypothetical protein HY235_21565 [Acidobacteria bacterium]|nr:hypothetical protein [Acidobacteriota bacterium]